MTPYLSQFAEFERSYDGVAWIEFCRNHAEIPVFAITLYLMFVFYVPGFLEHRKALRLKHAFAAWNAALAVFSCIGTMRTAPHLYDALTAKGLDYTLCTPPNQWFRDGPVGLWMALFIYSKIPELLDTCFLVLQKKRVLFLGWFHHTTVLLYCWHAFHNVIATGLWFATMNYAVHTVMYAYYFATVFARSRPFAKAAAPFITCAQIAQMAVGSAVTARSGFLKLRDQTCHVDPSNIKLGLVMYGVYFVLFTMLFRDKYLAAKRGAEPSAEAGARRGVRKNAAGAGAARGADKVAMLCGVSLTEDGAGFFQPDGNESPEKQDNAPAREGRRKTRARARTRKKVL